MASAANRRRRAAMMPRGQALLPALPGAAAAQALASRSAGGRSGPCFPLCRGPLGPLLPALPGAARALASRSAGGRSGPCFPLCRGPLGPLLPALPGAARALASRDKSAAHPTTRQRHPPHTRRPLLDRHRRSAITPLRRAPRPIVRSSRARPHRASMTRARGQIPALTWAAVVIESSSTTQDDVHPSVTGAKYCRNIHAPI